MNKKVDLSTLYLFIFLFGWIRREAFDCQVGEHSICDTLTRCLWNPPDVTLKGSWLSRHSAVTLRADLSTFLLQQKVHSEPPVVRRSSRFKSSRRTKKSPLSDNHFFHHQKKKKHLAQSLNHVLLSEKRTKASAFVPPLKRRNRH